MHGQVCVMVTISSSSRFSLAGTSTLQVPSRRTQAQQLQFSGPGNDALILQDPLSHSLTLRSQTAGDQVRVDWFGAPVLGLWAKPGAPYVCVEPWYGIDDHAAVTGELTERPRINRLLPGQSFRFPVHITVL